MKISRQKLAQFAAIVFGLAILAIPITVRIKNASRVGQTHQYLERIFAHHNNWEGSSESADSDIQKHSDHLSRYTRGVRIKESTLGETVVPWLDFGHVVPYELELVDGRFIEGEFDSKTADWGYLWVTRGNRDLSDAQMLEFDEAAAKVLGGEAVKQKRDSPQLEWVMIASDNEEFRRNSLRLLLSKRLKENNLKLVGLRFPQERPTVLLYPSVWKYGSQGIHIEAGSHLVGVEEP